MTELQPLFSPDRASRTYEVANSDSPQALSGLALDNLWPQASAVIWPRGLKNGEGGKNSKTIQQSVFAGATDFALKDSALFVRDYLKEPVVDHIVVTPIGDTRPGPDRSCAQKNQFNQNVLDTSVVSSQELTFMQAKGAAQSVADISAIKCDIARNAEDPEKALLNATQKNRVVGFGDIHGPLGPQMSFLADEMPALKQAGVTHLALEIPQNYQNYITRWNAADQNFLRDRLKDRSSLIDVIDSAKKAGIDVVGVDELYGANGEMLASRDRTMAKNIESILKDPQAKVTYFAGGEHLQNGFRLDSFGPSAVDILRQDNISVATFLPQVSSSEDALMHIARNVKEPVSVPVSASGLIGHLHNAAGTAYEKWDNVIFYPPHYKMDAVDAELKQFGQDPAVQLKAAVANKRVLLVGEMSQAAPEQSASPHRQFMASLMPDLKKAGLTDLAIDIPVSYQKSLEHYAATGTWDGPLPDSYDQADFRAVLAAAQKEGLKLHAVGLQNESLSTMQDIINGLTDSTARIAQDDKNARVLLWCREEKIANFDDSQGHTVSVSANLQARGITSQSFASLTQDFTDWSLGYATEITPTALTFDPSQTKRLQELSNTMGLQIKRFDNVIIYPSP